MRFDRITTDPDQMGGLPCIRGLRIIDAFPDLMPEDIEQARIRIRPLPIDG